MSDPLVFSIAQLAAEATREVGQRRKVYGRLVERGNMTQRAAEERIAMMEAIARLLEAQAAAAGPQAAGRLL